MELEKIEFIEEHIAYFMEKGYEKINERENVSLALLNILLSNHPLVECEEYDFLLPFAQNYEGINFYGSVIEVISNLQSYTMKMLNYSMDAYSVKQRLDEYMELYRKNSNMKIKKMA